ncbi:pyridoxal phosphate-dependent aminotransferase [Cellulosimicrobium marinum]|uniref:pyridoxal phosphate-dependent aminotransferase n=1 Tax=Cellulosimicrobium marinum TaxID=1638992 RepID=UPI001E4791CB|nr:pyridoxal phosphate-dependent aminotransferase [Cellulosimicrobium marinum]
MRLERGEPAREPAPALIEALRDAALAGPHGYTDAPGDLAVRETVAGALAAAPGRAADPTQVLLVPGSNLVLHLTLLALVGPGDEVLVPDPGFPVYAELVRLVGGVVVGYDPCRALHQVSSRTRMIVVNQPGNPTGGALAPDTARSIVDASERLGAYVLRDEAYRVFGGRASLRSGRILDEVAEDRTILMETLSKSHALCGWRLGIGILPRSLVDDVARIAVNTHCCMPTMLQRVVARAMVSAEVRAWVRTHVADQSDRLDRAAGALAGVTGARVVRPDGGLYLFPDITGTGLGDVELADRLLDRAGVAVVPGSTFGPRGTGHVRIATSAPLPELDEGLRRFTTYLEMGCP